MGAREVSKEGGKTESLRFQSGKTLFGDFSSWILGVRFCS